ncbi:hypothetical protein CEXT_216571 [Caerostris extrusa]|uniref:Uncharacterized protein n=1 Tax=Caerostris extrusa TaxID=172846 RepID=A0AAV4YDX1_CAEEX|nr:hypothetical protein CEXT_216571 [Caerostris extrusa]
MSTSWRALKAREVEVGNSRRTVPSRSHRNQLCSEEQTRALLCAGGYSVCLFVRFSRQTPMNIAKSVAQFW